MVGPSGKRLGTHVVETNARALIEVLRRYGFLVGDVVRVKNRLRSVLRSRGVAYGAGQSVYTKRDREQWLEKLPESMRV